MDKASEMALFVRVVEEGSFSSAARSLNLTPSAVSKQIGRLEDRLGVRLLQRTTRQLSLTEEGRVFYDRCVVILAEIEEVEQSIIATQGTPQGTLRINAPVAFGRVQLATLLSEFMQRFPLVRVELELTDRTVNILDEGIDVLIRVGELGDSSYIARRLADARRFICAAPDYLARHGVPRTPADLKHHNCLRLSVPTSLNDWEFSDPNGRQQVVAVAGSFSTNITDMLHAAALSGIGLARLSTIIIGADIRAGRLVPVLTDYVNEITTIYAVYPHRRHLSPKVRVLVDFLADKFAPVPPWETDICRKLESAAA
ncbi:MAG: LysR family transcriptional regulator [Candidatus Competibacteraceae bacterium]|nr:LysR family transcriptional regulator [Candidatus Competibacteraceae bacterium]